MINTSPKKAKHPLSMFDFTVSFFSFLALLLNNQFGMLAIIGFITPWGLIFIRNRNASIRNILPNWPLLLMPGLAIISTIWSDDPRWTLKAGIEFTLTVVIGIMAGTRVKPLSLIAALLCALLVIAFASLANIGDVIAAASSDQYVYGVFGSKNQFSMAMSLLFLVSIVVAFNKLQPTFFRCIAVFTCLFTPLLLIAGNSLGAILGVIIACMTYTSTQYIKRFPKTLRVLAIGVFMATFVSLMIIMYVSDIDTSQILTAMGKDASLTGRTFLWDNAKHFISERPLQGTGFGAFWRLDNPRAQMLWYDSHVVAGSGFNFHNEYLETLVETGIMGFVILVGLLLTMLHNCYRLVFNEVRPEQSFAFILFIFYIVRTPVEVNLVGQFDIGAVMFCILWIYLKPTPPEKPETAYLGNFITRGQPRIMSS